MFAATLLAATIYARQARRTVVPSDVNNSRKEYIKQQETFHELDATELANSRRVRALREEGPSTMPAVSSLTEQSYAPYAVEEATAFDSTGVQPMNRIELEYPFPHQ